MSASKGFFGTQHSFANAEHAALYRSLGGFLQRLLVRQFDVPQEDAELLVWETFHVYYDTKVPVPNERAWLISSACTIANTWLENRGLPAANEAAIARTAGQRLSYREARELLTERAQKHSACASRKRRTTRRSQRSSGCRRSWPSAT